MCGIIGYTGKQKAVPILLDGLERLEYRGYDSAGVAVLSPDAGISVKKSKGRLAALKEQLDTSEEIPGNIGIGHTRWATHGEPNDTNAHPHLGGTGKIAVVHNGIIENYLEIKNFLLRKGITFFSETDTEVVAQLLEYYYNSGMEIMEAVYAVLNRIEGAYALGILCTDFPDRLIAARKDAPLLIGYGNNEHFIASDVTALLPYTKVISYMEDYEVAVLTSDHIEIYDKDRCIIGKQTHTIEWDITSAEKSGYSHFMLKEICEQPEAVRKTISPRLKDDKIYFEELAKNPDIIKGKDRIYIVACGSAYHVGVVGKYILEKLLRIPVEAVLASEFRYSDPIVDKKSLVIVISQSGETFDTVAAMREAKRLGATVMSIVNVVGSTIARESDIVAYTWAGPEIAVATTKAYTTQMVLLIMLGVYFASCLDRISDEEYHDLIESLKGLPEDIDKVIKAQEKYQKEAFKYFNHDSVFFIGRNLDYALGLEGSLKLKEISYIHSESYAAGELKHGTISLIEPGTLVVAIATMPELIEKTCSNIIEVKSRGAQVIAICVPDNVKNISKNVEGIFEIPMVHPILRPVAGVVPLQLFAYYVALNRGCDIDKPRNLAKSVTVE